MKKLIALVNGYATTIHRDCRWTPKSWISGFVLTPSADVDCTITPWDELPSDYLN